MVRFIIFYKNRLIKRSFKNLHSNMVRFIIEDEINENDTIDLFTFQYG